MFEALQWLSIIGNQRSKDLVFRNSRTVVSNTSMITTAVEKALNNHGKVTMDTTRTGVSG